MKQDSRDYSSSKTSLALLLSAKGLAHSFDYTLYEDLNLDIYEKDTVATLLHNLSTLLKPKEGKILYKDRYLYDRDLSELLKIRRDEFGIIFQQHYLFKGFSVKENFEISTMIASTKIDNELLLKLGILSTLKQNVADLSGGQQQRVSIARVLMKKPKVIFADELTGNLDRKSADDVMDVMIDYTKSNNSALIIVTHDELVAKRCNKIYRLQDKRLSKIEL